MRHLGVAVVDQKWAEEIGRACREDEPTTHLAPVFGATDRVDESARLGAGLVITTAGGRTNHGSVVSVVEHAGV